MCVLRMRARVCILHERELETDLACERRELVSLSSKNGAILSSFLRYFQKEKEIFIKFF